MVKHFIDYQKEIKRLFIKVFGQDIFNDFKSNENNLDFFIKSIFEYGVEQCENHDLLDAKKHLALIRAMTINDISEVEKLEEKEKNRKDFSYYIDSSKNLMKSTFGFKLYNRIKNIKLVAFEWDGLDISTSSILATTPGIKERFNEDWVKYFSNKEYTALDLFLHSIFHFGYQYGMDTLVSEIKEETDLFINGKLKDELTKTK